ncbi:MAG TPA: 4-hydroxy-tetrahydrodipicolinate synthase [Fibrobacteria bacterium]|nr:4-hydroxy-tetrahydrodipicolinate synthase [Fibrobacteria bacterium]
MAQADSNQKDQATRGKRRSLAAAKEFAGVFPAVFTPLNDDDPSRLRNTIDYAKAKTIIDDLIAAGVDGLVPVGTTGQSPTVSPKQHIDFIKFTLDYVDGRVPIIAGAGSNATRETVDMIQAIQRDAGELACLCVTGYYNNPPQEGLVRHFETVARETGAKIVIYNVPGRTSSYLEPDTLVHLSRNAHIIGLKQSVDFRNPGKHRDDTRSVIQRVSADDLSVVSGEDDSLFAILEMGGRGIITASGNIPEVSRTFLNLIKAYRDGDRAGAEAMQAGLDPVIKAVFCRKNPIPLGTFFNSPLYLPLVPVRETKGGEEDHGRIMDLIATSAPSLKKYHG